MTYTGDGLSYNGIDLVSAGYGQPLLLENTTTAPVVGPTTDNLTIVPALTGAFSNCCLMRRDVLGTQRMTNAASAAHGMGCCT
jgi:hypothetical protein